MTNRNKIRGDQLEREVYKLLTEHGLSASYIGKQAGCSAGEAADIAVTIADTPLRLECKRQKHGFKTLYGWLEAADILAIRADRKPALAVLPLSLFLNLVSKP